MGSAGARRRQAKGRRAREAGTGEEKQKKDGLGPRLLTILSTHPLTPDRVAMVRKLPDYPVTPALSDAEWRALRGVCAGGLSPPPRQQVQPAPPPPRTGSDGQNRGSTR